MHLLFRECLAVTVAGWGVERDGQGRPPPSLPAQALGRPGRNELWLPSTCLFQPHRSLHRALTSAAFPEKFCGAGSCPRCARACVRACVPAGARARGGHRCMAREGSPSLCLPPAHSLRPSARDWRSRGKVLVRFSRQNQHRNSAGPDRGPHSDSRWEANCAEDPSPHPPNIFYNKSNF